MTNPRLFISTSFFFSFSFFIPPPLPSSLSVPKNRRYTHAASVYCKAIIYNSYRDILSFSPLEVRVAITRGRKSGRNAGGGGKKRDNEREISGRISRRSMTLDSWRLSSLAFSSHRAIFRRSNIEGVSRIACSPSFLPPFLPSCPFFLDIDIAITQ